MKTQSFFFFFCIIPAVSQFFDCILIYLQILISNLLQGNLQQVKRRVNSHILGLCGLRVSDKCFYRGMEACLSCKFIFFQSDIQKVSPPPSAAPPLFTAFKLGLTIGDRYMTTQVLIGLKNLFYFDNFGSSDSIYKNF